jgi:hypothetical protein
MAEITASVTVRYASDWSRIDTEWSWNPETPYLLTVVLIEGDVRVRWEFARDLLADGLEGEAGEADVQIRARATGEVSIRLESPDGTATYLAPGRALTKFLRRTITAVPRAREHVDVDSVLAKILAGA